MLGATALALAAHPAGDGVLAAVSGDGLYDVRFGAAPSITKVAGLASIRGVAVDVASGSALITGTSSGWLFGSRSTDRAPGSGWPPV